MFYFSANNLKHPRQASSSIERPSTKALLLVREKPYRGEAEWQREAEMEIAVCVWGFSMRCPLYTRIERSKSVIWIALAFGAVAFSVD